MKIMSLRARLRLHVDFRPALGVAEVPPLNAFAFELDVATDASEDEARVRRLADERCPAIWAMDNRVAHTTEVRRT
jgi:hypothetical protein